MTMASMPGVPVNAQTHRYAIRSYRLPAKVFHWLTIALVVALVSSAVIAKQLNDGYWSDTLFMLHKTAGIITLAVVLMRLCYRLVQSWTARQQRQPARASRTALHWLLYAIIILVPLAGCAGISDFGAREIFPGFTCRRSGPSMPAMRMHCSRSTPILRSACWRWSRSTSALRPRIT
jgi:cytochrome b561